MMPIGRRAIKIKSTIFNLTKCRKLFYTTSEIHNHLMTCIESFPSNPNRSKELQSKKTFKITKITQSFLNYNNQELWRFYDDSILLHLTVPDTSLQSLPLVSGLSSYKTLIELIKTLVPSTTVCRVLSSNFQNDEISFRVEISSNYTSNLFIPLIKGSLSAM